MDQRLLFHRIQNRTQRILNWQDEASGQLLKRPSGIHECRGVGEKFQPRHGFVELPCGLRETNGKGVALLRLSDVGSNAPQQLGCRLRDRPLLILDEVPLTKDNLRLGR